MSNKKDKDLVNAIGDEPAFDDDIELFEGEGEKSDLAKQKKLAPRGQKIMMLFFIGLSLLLVGWLAYGMMTKPKEPDMKSKEKRDAEQSNVFANASPKDFNEGFAQDTPIDTPAASEVTAASEPIGLVDTGAPVAPVYNQAPVQPVNFNQPVQPINAAPVPTPQETALQRKLNSGFVSKGNSSNGTGGAMPSGLSANSGRNGEDGQEPDSLASKLTPTAIKGVAAQRMMNRDYMISAGSMIDCALETKFNSTTVGMLSCNVTRNIYSASGRVILIDRGSKIIGQYKGGLQQGQARVFVLWTRVETPRGVIMNIDSPSAGGLGDMGMDGRVNNHFWKRFGGAMLVSVVDGLGKALGNVAANKLNEALDGDNYYQSGMSSDSAGVAEKIIENTINIPPTLIKHQGDRINVYVSRDLDFSGVYKLQ